MMNFLDHIANKYTPENRDSLKSTCFVFPSRRASIYFTDILKKNNPEITFWSPVVLSIEEFVKQHSPTLTVVNNIQLLFKLYEIYTREAGEQPFDEFYAWGTTLLKDFDEIDRHLVDGEILYRNIKEFEDLEAVLGPSEEVIAAFQSFQSVFNRADKSELVQNFAQLWKIVGKVYRKFKSSLLTNGWAYIGLCYREVAESLVDGTLTLPYEQIVFAGFNAISKAEELIIDTLLDQGKARLFFDGDKYYFDNDKEEAGEFLRKYRRKWYGNPQVEFLISDGFNQQKDISIIGVEQKSVQVKSAAEIAENLLPQANRTAIVMADENLLLPLLYALPQDLEDLNVTMGFSIAGTSLATVTLAYLRYQESISFTKNGDVFVNREALNDLLAEPFLAHDKSTIRAKFGHGKSRFIYYSSLLEVITGESENVGPTLELVLKPATNSLDALKNLTTVIAQDYYTPHEHNTTSLLENDVRATLLKHLNEVQQILELQVNNFSYSALYRLLKESFRNLSTPFAGEPLASLQVMGFLETRILDFENIVLLSVNEDLIPANSSTVSFIPFGIRKAFNLPTFLENNSIYAYHFYRLLQRAKNIFLIYSTELSVTGGGEKSRFIQQLQHAFDHQSQLVTIHEKFLNPQLPAIEAESRAIIYEKKGAILKNLQDHLSEVSTDRQLSPTGLSDYISCKLKYYLLHVLKIREKDEETTKIDARIFGQLFHHVLEMVYENQIGKDLSEDDIRKLKKNTLPGIVEKTFNDFDKSSGEAAFTKHVISSLAKKILDLDSRVAPFNIIDLESKNTNLKYSLRVKEGLTVKLGGMIDRLDRVSIDGVPIYRILDYKTGSVELKSFTRYGKEIPLEEYIESHFSDPKFKSGFQLLFYLVIIKRLHPERQVTGGIIGIKNLNQGITYLNNSLMPISDEVIDMFEDRLASLINEIADPDIPFNQTEDLDQCKYCQFNRICKRG